MKLSESAARESRTSRLDNVQTLAERELRVGNLSDTGASRSHACEPAAV